jgi:hypothetical protein
MGLQALKIYLEGLGFRSVEPILGVRNVTILNCWIQGFSKKRPGRKGGLWVRHDLSHVSLIEMDERNG